MRLAIERIFQAGQFKAGQKCLRALPIAALLALGALALTPQAALAQFVCDSVVPGGVDGASAAGAGSVACGTGATALFANSAAYGNLATTTRIDQMIFGTTTNT